MNVCGEGEQYLCVSDAFGDAMMQGAARDLVLISARSEVTASGQRPRPPMAVPFLPSTTISYAPLRCIVDKCAPNLQCYQRQ